MTNTAADATVMPDDMLALSATARWRKALTALGHVMADPDRTDEVLAFTGLANAGTLARRTRERQGDPAWEALYTDRPTIDSTTIDIPTLLALPAGTLGRAYAEFLTANGLTPDVFDGPPPGIKDDRTAYAVQRMRQTHDLWHVATGHNTDFAGEIRLQAFTYAQLDAPSSLILAAVGSLKALREYPHLAAEAIAAYRAGKRANSFATFRWEQHWTTPLAEVRRLLGVTRATYPRLDGKVVAYAA